MGTKIGIASVGAMAISAVIAPVITSVEGKKSGEIGDKGYKTQVEMYNLQKERAELEKKLNDPSPVRNSASSPQSDFSASSMAVF